LGCHVRLRLLSYKTQAKLYSNASDAAIIPVLELFDFAKTRGIAQFFVTGGQQESQRALTIKNLTGVGYSAWSDLIMQPDGNNEPARGFKSRNRQEITTRGYTIILTHIKKAIWAAVWSTCLAVLICPQCAAQSHSSTLDAVTALKLPKQPGDVPLYYSACCRQRAMEVQSALEDCLHFYKEKLGIQVHLVAAVLDKSDYDRVIGTTPNPNAPYGMAGVSKDAPHIALIPATDGGVITENLLAVRNFATPATLNRLHLLHLNYDQAARRYILHPALHELGHTLVYEYGIHAPTRWFDELLAHYIAYAFERAKRPSMANIVKSFTTLAAPPPTYTSLEDFEQQYRKMFTQILPGTTASSRRG
jgi:hypothetical protein